MRPLSSLPAFRGVFPAILWLVPTLLSVPSEARAQGEGCDVPSHQGLVMTTLSNDTRMLFFQSPILRCPGGVRISADSARVYESTNYTELWGDVVFWDLDSRLTAGHAQYFSDQGRLVAEINPVLTKVEEGEEGSVIRGDDMILLRAGPQREVDNLIVTGRRPHATLYPTVQPESQPALPDTASAEVPEQVADSALAPADSVLVPADSLLAPADSVLVPADSLLVPTDSVVVPADSAVVALDSAAVQVDPVVVAPDSLVAAPDSTVVAPDSTVAAPDSLALPPDSSAVPADSTATLPDSLPAVLPDSIPAADVLQPEIQLLEDPPVPLEPEPEVERVPYEIDARRFDLEGTRYFRASGSVVVTRDSLRAEADSLEYDQEEGALFLSKGARVTTAQTDLAAANIRLAIPQDDIRDALATGRAVLEGKDLRLLAPIVTLFFTEGRMERLVAVRDLVDDSVFAELDEEGLRRELLLRGELPLAVLEMGLEEFPRRPYALAKDFILEGDSLEVRAPGEVLEEVKAMGAARGESSGVDSLSTEDTPPIITRDWLEGDTIVAYFSAAGESLPGGEEEDPVPVPAVSEPDSTGGEYRLQRLLAQGNARSMYRMAASDSIVAEERGQFAIHYVVGDEITVLLNPEGEAEKMEVVGQTRGIHLEPLGRKALGADSLAVDTLLVPDTSAVRRPGGGSGG